MLLIVASVAITEGDKGAVERYAKCVGVGRRGRVGKAIGCDVMSHPQLVMSPVKRPCMRCECNELMQSTSAPDGCNGSQQTLRMKSRLDVSWASRSIGIGNMAVLVLLLLTLATSALSGDHRP